MVHPCLKFRKQFTKSTSLSYFKAQEKFVYKTNLAFLFLGSGKNDLQNLPRFFVSRLGKNSFTKRIFSAILSQAKVFNVIL